VGNIDGSHFSDCLEMCKGYGIKMHSYELEKYTLEVINCGGCGKPITVPVPYKGLNLCSGCRYGQSIYEETERQKRADPCGKK